MKKESEVLLEYMKTHFEEVETLLKMGLVQNLSNELGVGIDELKAGITSPQPQREEKLIVQVDGEEWNINDCRALVIKDFVSSGHAAYAITALSISLKPKEHKAYYVINDKYRGSIDLPDHSWMLKDKPSTPEKKLPEFYRNPAFRLRSPRR